MHEKHREICVAMISWRVTAGVHGHQIRLTFFGDLQQQLARTRAYLQSFVHDS